MVYILVILETVFFQEVLCRLSYLQTYARNYCPFTLYMKNLGGSDLMQKFKDKTTTIVYSEKKTAFTQLELRINSKELFCYLQTRIIKSILFWKRKRKNETKYLLLQFIVIAIPNRLLYFSFNSQCASAFFQNENHSTTPIVA